MPLTVCRCRCDFAHVFKGCHSTADGPSETGAICAAIAAQSTLERAKHLLMQALLCRTGRCGWVLSAALRSALS